MLSRLANGGHGCDRNITVLKHQPADQHISIKPRMAEKMSLTGTDLKAKGQGGLTRTLGPRH
jgi:hypothetical protein